MTFSRIATTMLTSTVLLLGSSAVLPKLMPLTQIDASAQAPAALSSAPPLARLVARGRVEPISEAIDVTIPNIGSLKAIYVDEGDAIHQGQLLATLDDDDERARVGEAEATAQLRQAELEKLQNGARPEERQQVAAQLQQTEATLALAKQELDRREPLAVRGVESQEVLNQAQSALGVAIARRASAAAAAVLINAPPRSEDVAIATANLALARATRDEQRALLAKMELRSPIDGTVLRRFMHVGEVVGIEPPTPILEIGDIRRLRVRAQIDETDVGHIALGQRCWITAEAYGTKRFPGIVSRIGEELGRKTISSDDPTEKHDTKVLEVLIDLDPDVRLPIGLRVDATVELPQTAQN